ncbi:hypothetical protein [Rhizobium leguminosarum]|uniref:hypothetical protein n=1 Tax=Rhizobium leguminosarum TaxID=384 RepID=UPI003F9E8D5B
MGLFSGNGTGNYILAWAQTARVRINNLTEEQIMSMADDRYAETLIAELVPEIPTIDRENISMDRGSVQTGNQYGQTEHYYEFFIPFTGPREVFQFQPSRARYGGVPLELRANELVYKVAATDADAEKKLDSLLDEVEEHLRRMALDFDALPREIRRMVSEMVPPKRQAIEAAKEGLGRFKFKMRRRDDPQPTYVTPEVKRKAIPSPRTTTAAAAPEPILEEAEYQHIMKVMDNMTHVMERSPNAFRTLGEEDIRTHFLFQLNGQYEGQATGETFNAKGKTDILIRVEDKNIFIGECKFWGGKKLLVETIDQLLGYLTWRDAKTALVVFNTNKNFTDMITTALDAVTTHPNYKNGPAKETDTRYRYVMKNKNDPRKDVIMTMMLYDIPRE